MGIRLLPSTLINRIAAGEVIERPASVVKEIVENAIDAAATDIQITIEGAGIKLIRIQDNGKGIPEHELPLAVERHATSKLVDDDLLHISSLGFRGEALPSIGSVSRLTLVSRPHDTDTAWQITVQGGVKSAPEPIAAPFGTTVEIRDLFYATPARLKFLKTSATEMNHIVDCVERLSMAYPSVAFRLISEGKKLLDLTVTLSEEMTLIQRLSDLLGRDFRNNSLSLDAEREGLHLQGAISLPTYHKPTGNALYFFVNNRPVKDKQLIGALRAAYQDVLAHDRYPIVALFLDIPPEAVDVNVHPAKAEVRFREAQTVRSLIVSAVKQKLAEAGYRASSTVAQATLRAFNAPTHATNHQQAQFFQRAQALPTQPLNFEAPNHNTLAPTNYPQSLATAEEAPSQSVEEPQTTQDFPLGIARGQIHNTYIVVQTRDGLVIVDQHAAHERLVYEQMKQALQAQGIVRDVLLLPEVIDLPLKHVSLLEEHQENLATYGLVLEPFGERAILVREIPSVLGKAKIADLVQLIAEDLSQQNASSLLEEKILERYATFACHNSVRAGRTLSEAEMDALLRDMEQTPLSGQCNHGRPTYVALKLSDIERLFGRK